MTTSPHDDKTETERPERTDSDPRDTSHATGAKQAVENAENEPPG